MAGTNVGIIWGSWSTDATLNAATVTASSNTSSSAVTNSAASPNELAVTRIGISVTYGATVTGGGATVSILGDIDGTHYDSLSAPSLSFVMPVTASTTIYHSLTIYSFDINKFLVNVANPATNSSITVTVTILQGQEQIG